MVVKRSSWNKGLTKETSRLVAQVAESNKGRKSWNEGLTKETDIRLKLSSEKGAFSRLGIAPWNKGLTKETSQKVAEFAAALRGKKKSGIPWNKGKKGSIPWNKGLPSSQQPLFGQVPWNKGLTKELDGRLSRPDMYGNQLSKDYVPKHPNSCEVKTFESLTSHSISYIPFGKIYLNELRRYVWTDALIPDSKIAIFSDGCYYHGCSTCSNGKYSGDYLVRGGNSISEVRKRDRFVSSELKRRGWTVIRIWEHDIRKDSDFAGKLVERVLSRKLEVKV
jgi:hypothetical protein